MDTFPCGVIYLSMTFFAFLTFVTFLGDRLFFKLFAKPLRSPVRANYNWIPLKGTHRPIRPIYFWSLGVNCRRHAQGHTWGLPAGLTCRIYLKWKVHDEAKYLKCNSHIVLTHLIHILTLALPLLLLYTHPTYRPPIQLRHSARTHEHIFLLFHLLCLCILENITSVPLCAVKSYFLSTQPGYEPGNNICSFRSFIHSAISSYEDWWKLYS